MTEDERLARIRRLQEQAAKEWKTPQPIHLDGPGPFELPLCDNVSLLGRGSDQTVVLLLESTKQSQTIRIPIQTTALYGIKALIDALLVQYVSTHGGSSH